MERVDRVPEDAVGIKGHPGYFICRNGDVYSDKKRRNWKGVLKLTMTVNKEGYVVFAMSRAQGKLHRILAKAFIPNHDDSCKIVRHLDDNKMNNDLSNLAWGRPKDNSLDMIRNGNSLTGEKSRDAKLSKEEVVIIRNLAVNSSYTQNQIGLMFNVTKGHVNNIIKGRTWKHI